MATTTSKDGRVGLAEHGIDAAARVFRNPTTSLLYTHALERGDGRLAEGGPLAVDTGKHTGRSPQGQVRRPRAGLARTGSGGATSTPRSREEHFDGLREKVVAHIGEATSTSSTPSPAPTRSTGSPSASSPTSPYHALFAKTMFIDPTRGRAARLRAAGARPARARGSRPTPTPTARAAARSSCCTRRARRSLIGGTFYAGEIKKSIFTLMNDRLPLEGVFPMHCSANVGDDGDVAVFFGLSGTGKTTLSADPERAA